MASTAPKTAAPDARKIRSARTRNLTAAKRSLQLVLDEAAGHMKALEDGSTVPDGGFMASALKYEQALAQLRLLDSLAGAGAEPEPDETANGHAVSADDVGLLIGVLRAYALVPDKTDPDTPLGHLVSFAFGDGDLPPYGGMVPAPYGTLAPGPQPASAPDGGPGQVSQDGYPVGP